MPYSELPELEQQRNVDPSLIIDVLLWVLVLVLVLVGILGLLLPALPGPPVLFAALLLGAWIDDFAYVGWGTLALLGGLAAVTYLVDFAAGMLGTSRFGASPRAAWGALIGALVGIAFGPAGILLGPFIGAAIGELSARRSLHQAGRAGIGATVGLIVGAAAKIGLAFTMLGIFVLARFF